MSKSKKLLITFYVSVLILGSIYVNHVISNTPLNKNPSEKEVEQSYPVSVILKFNNGSLENSYNVKLKSTDTVKDLLEEIRDHNNFSYELTEYYNKIEIDTLNKIKTPLGYRWVITLDGKDITNEIGDTYLVNNATYELKLIKL